MTLSGSGAAASHLGVMGERESNSMTPRDGELRQWNVSAGPTGLAAEKRRVPAGG